MIFVSLLLLFSALLLFVCGIYLTAKSGFFQILHFPKVIKSTFGKLIRERDLEGFKAMSIALGSTIGIGNIVGVTAAICIGGPGAVFWMLITGIIGMMTKFAEIYICADEAKQNGRSSGGPMYVFRSKGKGYFKHFGGFFAVSTVAASLMAGNISQSKSIYEFAKIGFSLNTVTVSVILLPLVLIIVSGKDKLYKNFSAVFVPVMSVLYVSALIVMTVKNIKNVPWAFSSVFASAFGFKAAAGGVSGSLLAAAVKTGVMKGLFTNEAGMGSSPIAHCSSKTLEPYSQGCWGIIEVFIDTVLVCMLTAVAVLTSPVYLNGGILEPFSLICRVFEDSFGTFGIKALSFSAVCFAFASIIGWSFYGIKAMEFLTKKSVLKSLYLIFFVLLMPASAFITEETMWALTDIFNSFMLIPNAVLLLYCGGDAMTSFKKGVEINDLHAVSEKMRDKKDRNGKQWRFL